MNPSDNLWERALLLGSGFSVMETNPSNPTLAGSPPGNAVITEANFQPSGGRAVTAERTKRICLVIDQLAPGGAERVISILANELSRRGWNVRLITFWDGKTKPFFPLDAGVDYLALNIAGSLGRSPVAFFRLAQRLRRLRQAIAFFDGCCVVSFLETCNILSTVASLGLGTATIVCERNDPSQHTLKQPWSLLRRLLYPCASLVVAQTRNALEFFPASIRASGLIIPNPVQEPKSDGAFHRTPRSVWESYRILAVGRLVHAKGFDMLIRSFHAIAQRHPSWNLVIYGEGHERGNLERMIASLGLGDRVELPGLNKNIGQVMDEADLFVLSSRYEGFPNVLLEAMAHGLAVISFDCRSGPAEMIRHAVNGILVSNGEEKALADAMSNLIEDVPQRLRLAEKAREVVVTYGVSAIVGEWEKAVRLAVSRKHNSRAK